MIQINKSHIGYYLALLTMLVLGFFMTVSAASYKQLQLTIVVLVASFYVTWGMLHHLINHDLTAKIVVEYILIGCFGIAAVFFLLKAGMF